MTNNNISQNELLFSIQTDFISQKTRGDVLLNMLEGHEYADIINNDENLTSCKKGDIFETICIWLIIFKCVSNVNYSCIMTGKFPYIVQLEDINQIFIQNIHTSHDGVSDLTIKDGETLIPFSIKYYETSLSLKNTDITDLDATFNSCSNYKIALCVKDKNTISSAAYEHIHKKVFDIIVNNGLLFDEEDIKKAYKIFIDKFSNTLSIKELLEVCNRDYLSSGRKQILLYFHQKLTLYKFIKNIKLNKFIHLFDQLPRSGKSLIILLSILHLKTHYNKRRFLIMTSVVSTIKSFINSLHSYIEFKDIKHIEQDKFISIDEKYEGIVFCSVQYLKINSSIKKEQLKKLNFDVIVTDECHLGSSTIKTKKEIFNISTEYVIDEDVNELVENIQIKIFASGTADKTKIFYKIPTSCIYGWKQIDISCMKKITQKGEIDNETIDFMKKRHGKLFLDCLDDKSLKIDYSKYPLSILLKHQIQQSFINKIIEYNASNNTSYSYDCSSLLALEQKRLLIKKKLNI